MQKLFETVNEIFKDRVANPFTSAFLISWCAWNYKFITILISSNTVSVTFELIKKYSFQNNIDIFLNGLLYPALTASIYIFLYPYPSRLAYAFTLRQQKVLSELKSDIEKTQLLTIEESQRLRNYYAGELKNLRDSLKQKELENDALINEKSELNNRKTKVTPSDEEQIMIERSDIDADVDMELENEPIFTRNHRARSLDFLSFLTTISDDNDIVSIEDIYRLGSFANKSQIKSYLAQLVTDELISKISRNNSNHYKILSAGHIAAAEHRELREVENNRIFEKSKKY